MGFRDPHAILLNRSSILVVTSVGVALLTLSYVLGVQVGKQSAALQRPASKGSGEDLKALPAPILDQIKSFDSGDAIWALTEIDPADSPAMVTFDGSPPNAAMFCLTQRNAALWSSSE